VDVYVKLCLDHIKDIPLSIQFDESVEKFPLLASMQYDKSCSITGNVNGNLIATREYDNIRVVGRVSVPLLLTCSRCLADYESFVDNSFTIFFMKEAGTTIVAEDEIELGEMDLLSSTYSGDEIDMIHEIEEQVAMEIPVKPLCSDNCKGLCHECGTDLNTSCCTCNKEPVHFTFSALKDFQVIKK
jgi:uncharacterized protein